MKVAQSSGGGPRHLRQDTTTPTLRRHRRRTSVKRFTEKLTNWMAGLRRHVQRELELTILAGGIRAGEVGADDIMDEVIVRAWSELRTRPQDMSLHRWLVELVHEHLDGLESRRADPLRSIDEPTTHADQRYMSRDGAVYDEAFHEEDDDDSLSTVVPDDHARDPFQLLEDEEDESTILDRLAMLPRRQRRAFTLFTLEEWTVPEIAATLKCSDEEVEDELERAREALRSEMNLPRL